MNKKKVQEKLGPEAQQLWIETMPSIRKVEEKYGQMRPDLSVSEK